MKLKTAWSCPSNIAIVKYWGKYGNQWPKNASISFTLKNAVSITEMEISPKSGSKKKISFTFDKQPKPSFLPKIEKYFDLIKEEFPFTEDYDFIIDSRNTFPHSSGIASSASGMAAMSMCIGELYHQLTGKPLDLYKASIISRLGSGSASRSVIPFIALWGKHDEYKDSSNEYAIDVSKEVNDVFRSFHDDILIVSTEEKNVSSTAGHELMNNNVYAETRYKQANENIARLKSILAQGDVESFGELAESEAMTLHALMMCSNPSYILIQPNTIEVIQKIRKFRRETKLPVYFTLDAGPNVHILYPDFEKTRIQNFIKNDLLAFAHNGTLIEDEVGNGPLKIF